MPAVVSELPPPSPPPVLVRQACPPAARGAICGFVRQPLDHARQGGPTVRIAVELFRRRERARPATSTVLSIEGGPGFPTLGDRSSRLLLWRPLSARRDLLLVDLRGTGRSQALDCPAFRRHILGYVDRAAHCARELGTRRNLYDTAQSVQDLAGVLGALHVGKVDLYGDSYGSYAAQAFAVRYPTRLRSLVLDSTYQLPGSDPAGADLAGATRAALRRACARRPGACPAGDPVGQLAALVARVRAQPIVGTAPNGDGVRVPVRLDENALVELVQNGYWYQAVWRDLPAAMASAQAGDDAPLLRLFAETHTTDGPSFPRAYSEALYAAVTCRDYPQLWTAGTPVSKRPAAVRAALAAYPPGTFAPFTGTGWTGLDYEGLLACLRWPSAPVPDPVVPPGAVYPSVPTLVLNGDLDNITPLSDARLVASRFPASTLVVVENSGHVTALQDQNSCASRIYTQFVRDLVAGDTSCASRTPEVRVVPRFWLAPGAVPAARPARGNRATLWDRRLAAAAASTVADVLQRWWANFSGTDVGLRGGRWSYGGGNVVDFHLRRVSFVPGVRVSGRVSWGYYSGRVRGSLVVRATGTPTERLGIAWSTQRREAVARLDGTAGRRALHARMPAP